MKKNAFFRASVLTVCISFVSLVAVACDDDTTAGNPNAAPLIFFGRDSTSKDTPDQVSVADTVQLSSSSKTEKRSSSSSDNKILSSSSKNQFNPWKPFASSSSEYVQSSSSGHGWYSSSGHEWLSSSESMQLSSSQSEESSSSANQWESVECANIRSTPTEFHKMTDVIKCISPEEKVAYVIRHAERNKSSTGTEGRLNDNGRKQSMDLGKTLSNLGEIFFMHTKVYRTMETVQKIAEGKGQDFSEDKIPFSSTTASDHVQSQDLLDSYFIKEESQASACKGQHSWTWSAYSYFAYEENVSRECQNAFYDADERIKEFIQTYFTYKEMHDITIAISHDQFLIPFIIAVSERTNIDLRFHKHENEESRYDYWINYLTGVAIIVDADDHVITIPVTAMEDPYLRVFPEN